MTRLALAAAAVLLCLATPARAALSLCNRTSYVLYAASAAITSPRSETRGWTRIAPGECQTARTEALTAETYLVYARSGLAHGGPARAWGGNFPMCVKDANFRLRQDGALAICREDGAFTLPFAALDTRGRQSWTMTLDETPALPSLVAAQLAGVKRLLRDNGYDPGPIDGAPSRKTGTAMTAFRKRVNFPEKAGNSEFFAALEREALRGNAPTGYTVCNDGKAAVEAALAETEGSKVLVRGWWAVPPGACARAMTTPLARAGYHLFVRRKDGGPVVSGPEKFCVAPSAFEIRERGDCAARKQAEAGFLPTRTGGLAGFVARVGDTGLLPGGAPARP